ncbi:unnamed protein product [Caretta caretta]
MAVRLFEARHHAVSSQKYRFSPSENLQSLIFSYLEERVDPIRLAVDVACGSGQSTRVLAAHFEKVVGTDISEAQIEAAKQAASFPNVSYQTRDLLLEYADEKVKLVFAEYKEVFESVPFQDKRSRVTGFFQSLSMYQAFLRSDPEAAKSLLQKTEQRFLDTMGVCSNETQVEIRKRSVCVLDCKGRRMENPAMTQ